MRTENLTLGLLKVTDVLYEQSFEVVERKTLLECVHKKMGRYKFEKANRYSTCKKFCYVQKQRNGTVARKVSEIKTAFFEVKASIVELEILLGRREGRIVGEIL